MTDFVHPMTIQVASKKHRCVNCGEHIEHGEGYCKQTGVYDGEWFTNKFHSECWNDLISDSLNFEFTPYSGERPQKEAA